MLDCHKHDEIKMTYTFPISYICKIDSSPFDELIPANDEEYLLFLSEQEACPFASYATRVTSPIPPAISM